MNSTPVNAQWNPSTKMGTVSDVIRRKGFLFILDVEDKSRFVMARDLAPCIDFDHLSEGVAVEFTPVSSRRQQNGLAAEAVHRAGCRCVKAVAAPSTVRNILGCELYKGVAVYNKTKKRNDYGEVDPRPRPESEWIRTPVEHLRIVSTKLWERCAARRKEVAGRTVRFEGGRISGRPPKGESKNLLAGLATCGMCGGGLVVETSPRKRGRVPEYVCYRRRFYGTCENRVHIKAETVNEQIMSTIEAHTLTPEAVELVVRLHERDDVRERQEALRKDQKVVAQRIERLVAVIADGGDAPSLLAKLRELEAKQKALDTELRGLRPVPRLPAQVVEDRLAEWRRLLRQSVTQGRAVLQRVLRGRIVFTPRGEGYDFRCETRFDKLFSGVAVERPSWAPEVEHNFSPEDTWDSDYGTLLELAHVKGMASPNGLATFVPIGGPLPVAA